MTYVIHPPELIDPERKPMVPTFDEACELAIHLCHDVTMTPMQRSAATNLVNFLERSAGPALKVSKQDKTDKPWFERHGRLTPEEAADLEASTYGKPQSAEQKIILTLEARIAEFEKAVEDQFKPALRNAIAGVVDEFLSDPVPGITMTVEEA